MFPDSVIAEQFQMKRTKLSYIISFGLSPYFKNELVLNLQKCSSFVVIFDESYNKITKSEQMDVLIKFWDNDKKKSCTRYHASEFLERGTASEISKHLKLAIKDIDMCKVVQISMDGPNTNLKFYRELVEEREQNYPENHCLIDIGIGGLHVLNGAFRTGATGTGWHLDNILRGLYNMFQDTYTRRTDFIQLTGTGDQYLKEFFFLFTILSPGIVLLKSVFISYCI